MVPRASGRRFRNREIKARQRYVEGDPEITLRAVTHEFVVPLSPATKVRTKKVTQLSRVIPFLFSLFATLENLQ